MIDQIPIPIALNDIVVLGVLAQWIAWRIKLPAIVLLLAIGILIVPVFHVLDPDKIFGDLLFPMTALSVGIILFEGSLSLRFREIYGLRGPILNLVTVGAAINIVVIAACAYYFLKAPIGRPFSASSFRPCWCKASRRASWLYAGNWPKNNRRVCLSLAPDRCPSRLARR